MNKKIVLATSNRDKIKELTDLLKNQKITIVPQSEFKVPDANETGLSFVENAILKARSSCEHTNLPAIADDSGIEVDALDGRPGIYSARYAGKDATSKDNIEKLLDDLNKIPDVKRTARFKCVMVYMKHANDPSPVIAEGNWEGEILPSPAGDGGFGYDPVFYVPGHKCSAAEISTEEKNLIGHRGQALKQLLTKTKIDIF